MTITDTIKKNAKTSKWIGILLLIAGFLSLLAPLGTGLSITVMIGVLLLFSGGAKLVLVLRHLQECNRLISKNINNSLRRRKS